MLPVWSNKSLNERGVEFSRIDPDIEKQKKGSTSHTPPVTRYAGAKVQLDKLKRLRLRKIRSIAGLA